MINPSIAWGHVAAVAVANFFLSWLWYSPLLFARPWMRALGLDPNRGPKDMTDAEKKKMPFLFLSGAVSSLLKAVGLACAVATVGSQDFGAGAVVGLLLWAALTLPASLDTLWEGRKGLVLLINNGLFALSYALFAGLLAAWH
jgi:hypothetical protein